MTASAPSPSAADRRQAERALDAHQVLDRINVSAAPSSAELDVP